MDLRRALGGGLRLQFFPVELPQHPQIDELGSMGVEAGLKQRGQVVIDRLAPQFVEPLLHLAHHMGGVVAQIQLQVGGQPGIGEVGRPSHHPMGAIAYQEGLAVQEPPFQATHLNILRAQPLHQPAGGGNDLVRKAEMVPLDEQIALVGYPEPGAIECGPPAGDWPTPSAMPGGDSPVESAPPPTATAHRLRDPASRPTANSRPR